MNLIRISILAAAVFSTSANAEVSLTTGAGYMNMAKELATAYSQTSGQKVTENYGGNIGQMMAQIANGSGSNVVISDEATLKNVKSPVELAKTESLGNTPLVFVWRKGLNIKNVENLTDDQVKSFAYPDPKAAVYGRAAQQYLNTADKDGSLSKKSMRIASVPQVIAYVAKGEIDAGFVNRTAAKANKDKIGGNYEIQSGYQPIHMVACVVKGSENDNDVKSFLSFLKTDAAKAILRKHGID